MLVAETVVKIKTNPKFSMLDSQVDDSADPDETSGVVLAFPNAQVEVSI
jgi:hypothetical protein